MGRSDKIRLVMVFAAAVLLAVMIGVVRCEVRARSDEETGDGGGDSSSGSRGSSGSSSGSSSSGSSRVKGYNTWHAERRGRHSSGAASAASVAAAADGLTYPQEEWCELRWDKMMQEWEELLLEREKLLREEVENNPDRPNGQDYQQEYDHGRADHGNNDNGDGADDGDYEQEEGGGKIGDLMANLGLEIHRVFHGRCKGHQKIFAQKLEAMRRRLLPSPVRACKFYCVCGM